MEPRFKIGQPIQSGNLLGEIFSYCTKGDSFIYAVKAKNFFIVEEKDANVIKEYEIAFGQWIIDKETHEQGRACVSSSLNSKNFSTALHRPAKPFYYFIPCRFAPNDRVMVNNSIYVIDSVFAKDSVYYVMKNGRLMAAEWQVRSCNAKMEGDLVYVTDRSNGLFGGHISKIYPEEEMYEVTGFFSREQKELNIKTFSNSELTVALTVADWQVKEQLNYMLNMLRETQIVQDQNKITKNNGLTDHFPFNFISQTVKNFLPKEGRKHD